MPVVAGPTLTPLSTGDNKSRAELEEECQNYERKIAETSKQYGYAGIHLFIGGIGPDGHIAFNEPGSSLKSRTRLKTLNMETIQANKQHFSKVRWDPDAEDPISNRLEAQGRTARVFNNNGKGRGTPVPAKGFYVPAEDDTEAALPPLQALTVGVQTVMDASEVMILVTGQKKALALSKCIEEGVSHQWTVSMVQLHPKSIIVCNDAATSEMRIKTVVYYKDLAKLHNESLGPDNPDLQVRQLFALLPTDVPMSASDATHTRVSLFQVPDDFTPTGQAHKLDPATERSIQRSNSRKSFAPDLPLHTTPQDGVSYAVAGVAVVVAFAAGFLASCEVVARKNGW